MNPTSSTTRDPYWNIVAIPTGATNLPAPPYAAYNPQTSVLPPTYVNRFGYTNNGVTNYWMAPNATANTIIAGSYNWIAAQTFVITKAGLYNFNFQGSADNAMSFIINGSITNTGTVLPTIVGGTQIGATINDFQNIYSFVGQAYMDAGTNTAYMVLNDYGGRTAALITQSTFSDTASPTWDGEGTNGNWSTGPNWVGDAVPPSGTNWNYIFTGVNRTSATNDYAPGTDLQGLYFAPEAGAFTISGNAIDFFAGKIENNSTNTQVVNLAGLTFNGGAQQINPIHGNITIGGSGNITNNGQRLEVFGVNGHTLTMEKNITGSGGVTLHGNSRLVITVDQSYTGGTVINGGTVQVGNGGTTGTLGTGNVTNNATLLVNRSNDITLSNAISGTGRLEINSGGTTTLAGINSYTGGTLVLGGVLFGASSGIQGNITNNSSVVFNQDSVTGAGTYAGAMSGTGSLTKQGGRILQLTGNNTYAGNTLVTGGELRVGNGGTAGTLGTGVVVMSNNATLSFNRANDFTLNNLITGAGTLTKLGAGTATLTASNAYTGSTIVSAGRLVINGQQSSATGVVTVNNGASLGGSGIIGGATTFLTGALHAPGNSPGVQTFNNGLLYSTGSVLEWELTANTTAGRGTSFDGINVNGGLLTIQSGAISTLVFNALGSTVDWRNDFWSTDQTWQVFDNSISPSLGTGSVFSTINLTADSLGATLGSIRLGATFAWDQQDNDLFLTYTAIPEPSAYMLLLLAGVSWVAVRLRKRRRVNP